jgi:hypothetical protein
MATASESSSNGSFTERIPPSRFHWSKSRVVRIDGGSADMQCPEQYEPSREWNKGKGPRKCGGHKKRR